MMFHKRDVVGFPLCEYVHITTDSYAEYILIAFEGCVWLFKRLLWGWCEESHA